MRFLKVLPALLGASMVLSACAAGGLTPKFNSGSGEFDQFAGCWSNAVDGVDDTFCFSRGSASVAVSFEDSPSGVQCAGIARARAGQGILVIEQPQTIGGCNDGDDFVAQAFECDLASASDSAMLCINRFTAADGMDYEYALVFTRS